MKPYYSDNGITIYHGYCLEVLASIRSESVDLVLTDPPYGVPRLLRGGRGKGRTNEPITGNNEDFDPGHLLSFKRVIVWGANHYANKLPASSAWLIWDKREGQTSDNNADCEMAWTNIQRPLRLYRQLWRGMYIRGEENGKPRLHPTQKPVGLMRWCIDYACLEFGSLIVDPYIGSGATLLAGQRAGHRVIGIEIEERYCEIAAKRLSQGVLQLEQPA
jgi:site-specific DNA-methyltransferase (adenine-specific)